MRNFVRSLVLAFFSLAVLGYGCSSKKSKPAPTNTQPVIENDNSFYNMPAPEETVDDSSSKKVEPKKTKKIKKKKLIKKHS